MGIIKQVETCPRRLWLEVKECRGANPLHLLDAAIPIIVIINVIGIMINMHF